ncbi:VOC family protein [Shewanella sp. MF05960]|uniref:VOC family protein n=1 Tax=Shewanella sp. MF05960 TaxID=3434874 RepID=UPI003D7BA0C7
MRTIKIIVGLIIFLLLTVLSGYYWLTQPPVQASNPVITGVHYVGMTVSNLERASTLYQQAMDLKIAHQDTIDNSPVINTLTGRENTQLNTQLMASVNAQLRFMDFGTTSHSAHSHKFVDANGPGIAHVCFQVNETTKAYDKFLAAGATHIGAAEMIQINPKNPVYYAYARDHDNIMVEIEHVDVAALNLPTPPSNEYRIRHISLATTDMERAVKFYSHLLETQNPRRAGRLIALKGEKVDKVSGFDKTELEMAWFQVRNLELEIIQYHNPAPTSSDTPRPIDALGYNMIVFDVVNLAKAKEKLLEAGGTIVSENQPLDGNDILFGRDVDGNLLGFQSLPTDSIFSAKQFANNGT